MKHWRSIIGSVAAVALGAGVVPAAGAAEPQENAQEQSCPAVHVILAPGTSETMAWGDPNTDSYGYLSSLITPVLKQVNSPLVKDKGAGFSQVLSGSKARVQNNGETPVLSRSYVNYPATAGGAYAGIGLVPYAPANASDTTSYDDSVKEGIDKTMTMIKEVQRTCPSTAIDLIGYSQGAEVMSAVSREIGAGKTGINADQIGGVALFADPTREAGTLTLAGGGDSVGAIPGSKSDSVSKVVSGLSEIKTPKAGGLSKDETGQSGFGALSSRVVSWCLPGDYVCGLPADSKLTTNLVQVLEKINLSNPIAALQLLAEAVNGAVKASDYTTNIADLDYGPDGFKTAGLKDQSDAKTSVLADRVASNVGAGSATPTTSDSASSSATPPTSDSATATFLPGEVRKTNGGLRSESSVATSEPAPLAGAQGAGDAFASPENFANAVLPLTARLGGMALGTGITVVRKTLTPENIGQIAVAGVTGGPQAAGAVAGAKFAQTGMTLLNPSYVSGKAKEALQALDDSGFTVPETMELAVDLSSWLSVDEHVQYGNRPMMPDGRTAEQATQQWLVASAGDMTGDANLLGTSASPGLGSIGNGSAFQTVNDVLNSSGSNVSATSFNADSATSALNALVGAK